MARQLLGAASTLVVASARVRGSARSLLVIDRLGVGRYKLGAMGEISALFRTFISLAAEHPQGRETARVFDRTLQFELEDDDPFYMQVQGGAISVTDGDSGLDWKRRDWERVTCVHTTAAVLRDIVAGRRLASEAFFSQELGFAPRRMADRHTSAETIVAWFYALIRLAHEQAAEVARKKYLSELGV